MSVWAAKNSGVVRAVVISHAVALAPFSQNSNGSGCAGLDQAQLTHWKPSGLFCCDKASMPLAGMPSRARMVPSDFADPQPPAGAS